MTSDTIQVTSETLTRLLTEYERQGELAEEAARRAAAYVLPTQSKSFESIEHALQWQRHQSEILKTIDDIEKEKECALVMRRQLAQEIIKILPVYNTWVKVPVQGGVPRAIGLFRDSWGGDHTELEVRPWSEDLPELKDRT